MVKNLEITGEITCLGDNAGGISAKNGSFENCINRVNIKAGGNKVGGIVGGDAANNITNCKNYGTIEGNDTVGGISATWGIIKDCQNYGTIKGIKYMGGINGIYGQLENCQNYGEIGEENSSQVAGIVGILSQKIVNKCINYGNIKGNKSIGGIVGDVGTSGSLSTIINCINTARIEGNTAGGILGYGSNFKYIINCYNSGEVIGNSSAGGIIGELKTISVSEGKIINCYNTGEIEAESYKGGIVGVKNGYGTHYIENCYWKEELNIECGENISTDGGVLEITNSRAYTEQEMKSDTFLTLLNDYVQTYNAGDKAYSNGAELLMWKFDEKTGFPMF